jgi:hypothetical protein
VPPKPLPELPANAKLEPLRHSADPEEPAPAKPPPLNPILKSVLGEAAKSVVGVSVATGVIAAGNGLVGQPQ